MRRILVLLALIACERSPPATETVITGTCIRAFRATLEAWESALGRAPDECAYLDAEIDVVVASADDMPCDEPLGVNEVRTECTQDATIYINEAFDNVQRTDAAVHGWVHVLARCVYGDLDADHLRAPLWEVYSGAESVEVQGQAGAVIGACL